MATKITIGLDKYDGSACSFNFVDSVCIVEEKLNDMQLRNIRKLQMLFRGSKIEYDADSAKKEDKPEQPAQPTAVPETPPPAPEAAQADDPPAEAPGGEVEPEVEAIEVDAENQLPAGEETEEMPAADPEPEVEPAKQSKGKKSGKKGKAKR